MQDHTLHSAEEMMNENKHKYRDDVQIAILGHSS